MKQYLKLILFLFVASIIAGITLDVLKGILHPQLGNSIYGIWIFICGWMLVAYAKTKVG